MDLAAAEGEQQGWQGSTEQSAQHSGGDTGWPHGGNTGGGSDVLGAYGHRRQQQQQQQASAAVQLRNVRLTEQAMSGFMILMNLVVWGRTCGRLTAIQHLQQAVVLLLTAASLAWTTLVPQRVWLPYRVLAISAVRMAAAALQISRSKGAGQAVMLDRPATPGWRGCIADWICVAAGSRVLLPSMAGSLLQQPPLAVLLQQSLLMAFKGIQANGAYCSSQLLTDPLTGGRIDSVRSMLDVMLALVPMAAPRAAAKALSAKFGALQQCRSVLTMQQMVLGVLLPLAVACCTTPLSLPDPEDQQEPREQPGGQPGGAPLDAATRRAKRAGAAVGRACSAVNGGLRSCFQQKASMEVAAVWWSLACVLWLVCMAAAAPEAGPAAG